MLDDALEERRQEDIEDKKNIYLFLCVALLKGSIESKLM